MNANIYETPEVDSIPEPAFRELLALVGSETSVLQIGVPDPATAEIIESHLGSRIAERVESARAVAPAGARTFDCIVFAQPLEGLKDPGMELEAARALLSASGSVLAVAANGTHASTRLAALDRANASGAAASDPLGAFSRYGIQELFERNGYVVTNWERQTR
ncbi:MAG: hypothetical protein QOE08_1069, partial [Thermoleophilaceae bacterium]|nr:hypothetical protein [Thermoleophilaceae bacterium]